MMMIPRRRDFDLFGDMFRDPFFTEGESKVMKTDIKEKKEALEKVAQDIAVKAYQQAQEQHQAESGDSKKDNTVDADFSDVQ